MLPIQLAELNRRNRPGPARRKRSGWSFLETENDVTPAFNVPQLATLS
jgi:hypothetical protein